MIYGIGVDITELKQIQKLFQKFGNKFVDRILTSEEKKDFYSISSLKRQVEFLGGRFSVKESYTKALGTGLGSIGFQDIAVLDDTNGKPFFLYQPFQGKSYVSISHTNELVFTEVILEAENEI